ncbi:MAG: PH domain-containing protein [Chloroflexia bacterium]
MQDSTSTGEQAAADAEPGWIEPHERLDRSAITLWRVNGLIESGFTFLAASAAAAVASLFADLPWYISGLPLVVALLVAVITVGVAPTVRWRRWRYEIREEVDLQRGAIYITRTLVPLARVQHVDTQQGPLERHFGLATVNFHTAAGAHRIPALREERSREVAARIGALAKVARDEPL